MSKGSLVKVGERTEYVPLGRHFSINCDALESVLKNGYEPTSFKWFFIVSKESAEVPTDENRYNKAYLNILSKVTNILIFFSVDYEKAFNNVEHYALFNALKIQGVGDHYIKSLANANKGCTTDVTIFANLIQIRKELRNS